MKLGMLDFTKFGNLLGIKPFTKKKTFYYQTWELGIFSCTSYVIRSLVNNLETFPHDIPSLVNNMEILPHVIPNLVNNMETVPHDIPSLVNNIGAFLHAISNL